MAKMILKWRYIKSVIAVVGKEELIPLSQLLSTGEHLVKYIATREGVEKCDESWKTQNATVEQQRLIAELLRDFPDAKNSFEYQELPSNSSSKAR